MTLAHILPEAQRLPAVDKLKLIRVLAEELDSGDDISPLVPHKVYYLPTPYGAFGAGQALMDAMKHAECEHFKSMV
jgi:hypothetical protein